MTTTTDDGPGRDDRRLMPADVHGVTFTRSPMLHPGYTDAEVDRFLDQVGEEIGRLHAEKAELLDQVRHLQEQLTGAAPRDSPSVQAVGILAAAQQTADQYVAEAEDLSRVLATEAREQYEEQLRQARAIREQCEAELRQAREQAGAIIQAAQEAAPSIASRGQDAGAGAAQPDAEELHRQVVYLETFGRAVRVQLRSYLEALLSDVETEWGRAHPAVLAPPVAAAPVPAAPVPAAPVPAPPRPVDSAPAPEDAAAGPAARPDARPDDAPAGARSAGSEAVHAHR